MKLKESAVKSARTLGNTMPVLVGVVLLVSLTNTVIPKSFYSTIFSKNILLDSFIGSATGSVLAGNPVTSYVLGGEMLKQGVSMVAVVAFLVAWVTVGVVQLPAESIILGKKFALTRNFLSFLFSILVAVVTVFVVSVI